MDPENEQPKPQSESDRRAAPRYPAQFNVEVTIGFGAKVMLQATSVSQSGVFLRSDAPPDIGDRVGLFIDLPYATVRLVATVRRVVSSPGGILGDVRGFAVQIDRIDEGEQAWTGLVRTAKLRAPKES